VNTPSSFWVQVRKSDSFQNVVKALQTAADKGQPSGFITVTDEFRRVIGVITDSDIRHCLLNDAYDEKSADEIMTKNFLYFEEGIPLEIELQRILESHTLDRNTHRFPVSHIPVIDSKGFLQRILNTEEVHQIFAKTLSETIVLGLGFVGLTLAAALARAEYRVLGLDIDKNTIEAIRSLRPSNNEPQLIEILKKHMDKNLNVSHIENVLPERSTKLLSRNYVIAVGTSLDHGNKQPQLQPLLSALDKIAADIRRGDLIVVRSTVGVGSTRKIVIPRIEEISGLKAGLDFFVASAPERTVEGKAIEEIGNLPQLLAGFSEECLDIATKFFTGISPRVVVLENLEACEFAKLISNAYRDTVFNFANELAFLAGEYGIDINRVGEDANSGYPRNAIPHPSPGVGGPCLVKDSFILREKSIPGPSLIKAAREFNDFFVKSQFHRVEENLNGWEAVIILGLAFKGSPPTNDLRDSFGVELYRHLQSSDYEVYCWDATFNIDSMSSSDFRVWNSDLEVSSDVAVLICNNHMDNINQFRIINQQVGSFLSFVYDPWRVIAEVNLSETRFKYLTLSRGTRGAR
jgi:UDP-N-acetyl-D-mannosaminuronic acid dehydrogenase